MYFVGHVYTDLSKNRKLKKNNLNISILKFFSKLFTGDVFLLLFFNTLKTMDMMKKPSVMLRKDSQSGRFEPPVLECSKI